DSDRGSRYGSVTLPPGGGRNRGVRNMPRLPPTLADLEQRSLVRRSAKLGLYAAVLLGLVGGFIAWFGTQKNVTVVVEGKAHHVRTESATVAGTLRDAHLTVG